MTAYFFVGVAIEKGWRPPDGLEVDGWLRTVLADLELDSPTKYRIAYAGPIDLAGYEPTRFLALASTYEATTLAWQKPITVQQVDLDLAIEEAAEFARVTGLPIGDRFSWWLTELGHD
jgi:hypothetical protein